MPIEVVPEFHFHASAPKAKDNIHLEQLRVAAQSKNDAEAGRSTAELMSKADEIHTAAKQYRPQRSGDGSVLDLRQKIANSDTKGEKTNVTNVAEGLIKNDGNAIGKAKHFSAGEFRAAHEQSLKRIDSAKDRLGLANDKLLNMQQKQQEAGPGEWKQEDQNKLHLAEDNVQRLTKEIEYEGKKAQALTQLELARYGKVADLFKGHVTPDNRALAAKVGGGTLAAVGVVSMVPMLLHPGMFFGSGSSSKSAGDTGTAAGAGSAASDPMMAENAYGGYSN